MGCGFVLGIPDCGHCGGYRDPVGYIDWKVSSKEMETMEEATLTVITGPMCSGKTRYLMAEFDRFKRKKLRIGSFRHSLDTRTFRSRSNDAGDFDSITVCNGVELLTNSVASLNQHLDRECFDAGSVPKFDVILLDEIQFFDGPDLLKSILRLLRTGSRFLAAGLDLDAQNRPWASTSLLMAHADQVIKIKAVCPMCQNDATLTQRLDRKGKSETQVEIGSNDLYEPRCRKCHEG